MAQNRTTLYQILENFKGDCLEPVITYVLLLQYYVLTFESLSFNCNFSSVASNRDFLNVHVHI